MEAKDSAHIWGYLVPPSDANFIKTVCLIERRAPDPFAVGSRRDADTATCELGITAIVSTGGPIGWLAAAGWQAR